MKKSFFALFFTCLIFGLVGCASTGTMSEDGFITYYDDVKDVTFVYHKDLDLGFVYNLKDSLTGERENIRLYLANDNLVYTMNYQYRNWAFLYNSVFLANGKRLEIPLKNRDTDVVSGTVVREAYITILSDDQINALYDLLSSGSVEVAFLGDKYNTGKIKIPQKVVTAMLATIEKYREL